MFKDIIEAIFGRDSKMLNPVFRKDMMVLLRNSKVYVGLAIYLFVLLNITNMAIKLISVNNYNGFNPEYIMTAYLVMLGFQMLTLTFIIPAVTSSSISGERERQTLDFLLVTRMSGLEIVVGKLMSSLLIVALIIIASMPIYSVIFYYGGISVMGFLFNTLMLLIYSCFVGSISVFVSTAVKKTAAATAVSNLIIIGITAGTGIVCGILAAIFNMLVISGVLTYDSGPILGVICIIICSINPVICFISIVDSQVGTSVLWNLIGEMLEVDIPFHYLQVWHIMAILYILVSIFFLRQAAKNILPVKNKKKLFKKG